MEIDTKLKSIIVNDIEEYLKEEEDLLDNEECDRVIDFLLRGAPKDLGGITALRGFIYQYFVAMYYMVEMIHSDSAWWTEVIYEFIDDVVLYSDQKMRIVQVKTVREDGVDRHLTQTILTSRKNGLNSWLDTLFLNLCVFRKRQKNINKNLVEGIEMQFEIATNASYDENVLKAYAINDNYQLSKKSKDDAILKNLLKTAYRTITENGKERKIEEKLEESLGCNPDWCLERLKLNYLGSISELRRQIISKISDICKCQEDWHPASELIFKELLNEIITRTHRDDLPDTRKLVFSKTELLELFPQWKHRADSTLYACVKSKTLHSIFDRCFQELKDKIEEKWQYPLKDELIELLGWLYSALQEEASKDQYVYERFLNRLFYMNFSTAPMRLESLEDISSLRDSIQYIILCLAFYDEKKINFGETKLLFKQGMESDNRWKTFAMYNAREKEDYDHAVRKVITKALDCRYSQRICHEYHCFVTHQDTSKCCESDVFSVFKNIAKVEDVESQNITDKPTELKIHNQDLLENIWSAAQANSALIPSFKDDRSKKIWDTSLNAKEIR